MELFISSKYLLLYSKILIYQNKMYFLLLGLLEIKLLLCLLWIFAPEQHFRNQRDTCGSGAALRRPLV